jgi:type IV secretion system protein VirB4
MLSSVLRQINQIKKENTASQYIPYSIHVDNHTIKTMEGDFLQVIKVEGIAHESADDSEINVWHEQFNQLLRNIASPNIAIWTHIIRREESSYPNANFNQIFAYQLNEKYKASLDKVRMFMNDLYVTIIYRPNALKVQKVFSKFQKTSRKAQLEAEKESLAKLYDTVGNVMSGLSRYEPTRLSVYEYNGFVYSDVLEFLAYLVNGEYQRIPLPKAPLNEVLTTTRPMFGNEVIELRKFTETEYASMISIQEYPSVTWPGLFDAILTAPFELILTQSFVFMDKAKATDLMQVNQRRMISAGDLAQSQIYEISQALDDLTSNRFVMGEHHLTLMIRSKNLKFLNDFTSDCRTVFADTGMKVVREDLAIEASFWAQLPGNFKMRPRPAPVTSRNFAGFSAFHNYPTGKRTGNHWGDAVALLQTASGSPYYFNFHKGSLGNTIIIGPSGSGKTVLQGFMLSMLSRYNATGVFFDKDRGAELVIRALGGRYLALKSGKATGFNPFHLEPNDANRLFMESLVRQLVASNGEKYNTQDMKMVRFAIDGVFDLPWHLRRLNSMRQFLDPTDPEGVSARCLLYTSPSPRDA